MTAFYDGKYDVLLSTAIVESGLDIPNANTLIVHRADMFGLAQLYQLRGRVGRSKARAYAYFTTPDGQAPDRGRREAPQGAAVARHAGRRLLAGQPRPRHPRRRQPAGRGAVGPHPRGRLRALPVDAGGGGGDAEGRRRWARCRTSGARRSRSARSVLIPETYVADLQLRLGLYRRLSKLETRADIDRFAAELVDRFGELPEEVKHLLDVVEIKGLRQAGRAAERRCRPQGRRHRLPQEPVRQPARASSPSWPNRRAPRACSPTTSSSTRPTGRPRPRACNGVRWLVRELAEIAAPRKAARAQVGSTPAQTQHIAQGIRLATRLTSLPI